MRCRSTKPTGAGSSRAMRGGSIRDSRTTYKEWLRRPIPMSEPDVPAAYQFGAFRLDVRQRLLLSRDTGRPLALTPKAFEILLHLVQRRGQLVEKPALMRAIWPNVVVEENN